MADRNKHNDDDDIDDSSDEWSDAVDYIQPVAKEQSVRESVATQGPPPDDNYGQLVEKCKTFWLALISNFLLLFLVAVYSIMGGFLFQFLEWRPPLLPKDHNFYMQNRRIATAYKIMGISKVSVNFSVSGGVQWAESADKILEEFQLFVAAETHRNVKVESVEWTFISSIVYSVTLITSIGYGNLTPNTVEGRIATIFYSMVGIPLCLLYLTSIGGVMADLFKFSYNRFASYRWNVRAKSYGDQTIRVPVAVTLTFIVVYNALGVLIFSIWENQWTPVISAYFCFITLTTIGLGDFVFGFEESQQDPWKQLVGSMYLVLGLSVMSMGFNLLKDEIIAKYRWVAKSLTKIKRDKENFVDVYIFIPKTYKIFLNIQPKPKNKNILNNIKHNHN
ncbi:hypothetical protein Btru_069951 [Bulinus truncatus]|nr:hypothetical protein Btru_069951 [Bulinus truncatus]